ncbi:MAG: GAF domain-containing protein [Chloroflexi bacterium]|nr:GAF domain-containing protein [Chloroflexota bacterium]
MMRRTRSDDDAVGKTIAEVARAVAEHLDLDPLLNAALDQITVALRANTAWIYLGDEARRSLRLVAYRNLSPDLARQIVEISFDEPLLACRAAASRMLEAIEDLAALPAPDRSLAGISGARGAAAVPLLAGGRIVGVLGYTTPEPRRFTPARRRLVCAIADILAMGMAQARARESGHWLEARLKATCRASLAAESECPRLRRILDAARTGITFTDAETGRVTTNAKAAEMLCQREDSRSGSVQFGAKLCHPDGHPLAHEEIPCHRAIYRNTVSDEELLIVQPDGRQIPVLAGAAPVHGFEGEMAGAVVVFQDVSALREQERLREEWISLITHDMRSPLTVIKGYAQLLIRAGRLPGVSEERSPAVQKALRSILGSAERLTRMVFDLLDASRIEARRLALAPEPVDLPSLVRTVVERAAEVTGGHPVSVEIEGDFSPLAADSGRLEQVLVNLLSNAAKYGYPGTEIRVEVARRGSDARVSVVNQGPGISADDLPQLFTRFYRTRRAQTTRATGIGLGLYISKGLVEAHGGHLWAESTPGETTAFRFTLPVTAPPSTG